MAHLIQGGNTGHILAGIGMWWLWDDIRCACLMTGEEKGFVCSPFLCHRALKSSGCTEQKGLVKERFYMFP